MTDRDDIERTTPESHRPRWLLGIAATAAVVTALGAGLAIIGGSESAPSNRIARTITLATTPTVPESSAEVSSATDQTVVDAEASNGVPLTIDEATTTMAFDPPSERQGDTDLGAVETSSTEPDEAVVVDGVPMAQPLPAPEHGGTQDTIVGDITWTRLVGDGSTQPERVEFVLDGDFIGTDLDGTTWRSGDGLTWTTDEAPLGGLRDLVDVPGETWAVRTSPGVSFPYTQNELLRRDGTTFEPFALPASGAPVVDGFRRKHHRLSVSRVGDRLAVVATETHDISLHDMVGGAGWQPEEVIGTTVTMRSSSGHRAQVEMIGEDGAASIDVTQDGQPVGTIGPWPGVDHDVLLGLLGDEQITYSELLIGGADGFEVVTAPSPLAHITDVATLGDDLLALAHEQGNDGFELWASRDGGPWERRILPRATIGDETVWAMLVGDGSAALLTVVRHDGAILTNESWHTHDGTTWQVANGAASFDDQVRADFGWLRGNFYDFTGHIAVSPDGITWQEISVDAQTHPSADGGSIAALGDTIIISRHEGGRRALWVGRVEAG